METSTLIPDLDNANVGTLCKRVCNCEDTEKITTDLTGDTLVSPFLCESGYKKNEIEREFMKGRTTEGTFLCELFFSPGSET